jgi:hypothetical protein
MAITGTKLFTTGDVLFATDVNQYLMRGVKVFASSADRDAAYGGAGEPTLEEGEMCFLADTNVVQFYTGSTWTSLPTKSGALQFVTSATIASGVSSVTVPAAFSADYVNYRVLIHGFGVAAGSPNVLFQLRIASTTAATLYYYGGTNSNFVNRTDINAANTTSFLAGYANTTAAGTIDCMIYRPFEVAVTNFYALSVAGINVALQNGGNHNSATSYDQLVVSLGSSTFTGGTISVYGVTAS